MPTTPSGSARWLQGELLETQLQYWKEQLSGAPAALELPTDRPRPAVQSFRGATFHVQLPKALSESIKSFSLRHGVTPYMTLLAGFQTLLHRYSGQDDISVGAPIAGRTRSEVEGLIGFFINTLVLRARLSPRRQLPRPARSRCATPPSAPTRTRTSPSRSWSRSCSPRAA